VEEPIVREQVCVLHRVGLQKLISMIGRFDTYKGEYRMDSLMNPSSVLSDMFLVTGGKGGVCAFVFFAKTQQHTRTRTHTQVILSTGGTERETA
jgi:hypothetical protein